MGMPTIGVYVLVSALVAPAMIEVGAIDTACACVLCVPGRAVPAATAPLAAVVFGKPLRDDGQSCR